VSGRWAEEPVLVTGAQGFMGSWLAERLLADGARVVVPIRDVHPDARFRTDGIHERCHLVPCDVTDYEGLLRVMLEEGIRAVFHLAAVTIVGTAYRSPLSTFETNARGTWTVLEACRATAQGGEGVERVVVASSDKAYGDQEELPYRESSPLTPRFPYDVSKACADLIARCYAETFGMRVAVTRYANLYGGGDLNWSRIVPDTARSLATGKTPVIRSDGTPERDYLYVEDAVDAYLAVAESLDDERLSGRAWNAGWGRPVPVREIVDRLIEVSGRQVEPEVHGRGVPEAEIGRQYLDATAMREQLGWSPAVALDDGLERAWRWYERRLA
jgi:CDP-glucose 4,6-dehydratase